MRTLEMLVNPFENKESDSPDNIEKIETTGDNAIDNLLSIQLPFYEQIYDGLLHADGLHLKLLRQRMKLPDEDLYSAPDLLLMAKIFASKVPVLTPAQISLFFNKLVKSGKADEERDFGGLFFKYNPPASSLLSHLINTSYSAGNNNFVLSSDRDIISCCTYLQGTRWNPLNVKFNGNVGNGFGVRSMHCHFNIDGNTGDFLGVNSARCNYHVYGDVAHGFANGALKCKYLLEGDVEEIFVDSWLPKACTFYAGKKETYARLNEAVEKSNKFHYPPAATLGWLFHRSKVKLLK